MVVRRLLGWARRDGRTRRRLYLSTGPSTRGEGALRAADPGRVVVDSGCLVARERVDLVADPATSFPLRRGRRYRLRLTAAERSGKLRLRVRQARDGGGEWVDNVPVTADGTGWFDSTSDARSAVVDLVLPGGTRVSPVVTIELDEQGPRPQLDRFVVIPGAMKSGTSTLQGYLRQHPRLVAARRKEPGHFNAPRSPRDPAAYRDWFRYDGRPDALGLDASTGYAKYPTMPDVAARLAAFPACFRMVYVMRDPVDRIESHLAHNVARGRVTLERALEEEQLRHALAVSSYATQLDRYAAAFDDLEERLLLLDFHDLVAAPIATVRRVEDFLGLEPHDYAPVGARNTRTAAHGSERLQLGDDLRHELWERLQGDLQRLIDVYGFDPARRWLHGTN